MTKIINAELDALPNGEEERGKLLPALLGAKLRRMRKYLGLPQGGMLRRINPTEFDDQNRARVSQYERSERAISIVELLKTSRLIDGVTMEMLADDKLDLPDWIRDPKEVNSEDGNQPAQQQSAENRAEKTETNNDDDSADTPPAKNACAPENDCSPEAVINESLRAEGTSETDDTEPVLFSVAAPISSSVAADVYSVSLSAEDADDCKDIFLKMLDELPPKKIENMSLSKFLELMILAARDDHRTRGAESALANRIRLLFDGAVRG